MMLSSTLRPRVGKLLRLLLPLFAITAGLFFRLHDLAKPTPFEDEAMTWLRVSGHTEAELNGFLYDGRTHTAGDISVFQRGSSGRGVGATVHTLLVDDPQHAPLYFVLERLRSDIIGDSLGARRLLSALAGIAFIAAFALLCFMLFASTRAALVGASLAALSPLHVIYSQQAREYELWMLLVCLWSVAALWAVRRNTPICWITYAFAAIAAFYTSLLSLPILFAHALWIAAGKERRACAPAFTIAAGCSLLAYAPWLLNLAARTQNAADANAWTATPWPPLAFAAKWAFNLSATFFDLTYVHMRYAGIGAFALAVLLYACIDLRRRASAGNASFIFLLGGVSVAVFLIPDALFHQHRSVTARYVFPVFIAAELAVAGMLAGEGCGLPARRARTALFAVLLALGTWSAAVRSTRVSWWENNKDAALPAIAAALDARPGSLLLAEDGTSVLALSNLLDPRTRVHMIELNAPTWSAYARRGAFVLTPSSALRARLQGQGLRPVPIAATPATASLRTFRGGLQQDDAGAVLQFLR